MTPVELATADDGDLDGLIALLRACVEGGASVGWVTTPDVDDARAFWAQCLDEQRAGRRRIVVARDGGRVVGTGQLVLAGLPNGRHRAEVAKILVAPDARRRGIARAVMGALDAAAAEAGRWLLVLDTETDSAAASLYATCGYTRVGDIPDYALSPDGTVSTTLFYKRLPGPKRPRPPRRFEPGPPLVPGAALRGWLDAHPGRVVRLPVTLRGTPVGYALTGARVGAGADPLAIDLDDTRLGIGLADHARRAGPTLVVEGTWDGARLAVDRVADVAPGDVAELAVA